MSVSLGLAFFHTPLRLICMGTPAIIPSGCGFVQNCSFGAWLVPWHLNYNSHVLGSVWDLQCAGVNTRLHFEMTVWCCAIQIYFPYLFFVNRQIINDGIQSATWNRVLWKILWCRIRALINLDNFIRTCSSIGCPWFFRLVSMIACRNHIKLHFL